MMINLNDVIGEELDAEAKGMLEAAFFSKRDRALVVTRECIECGVHFEDGVYEVLKDVYDEKLPFCLVCDSAAKVLALVTKRREYE